MLRKKNIIFSVLVLVFSLAIIGCSETNGDKTDISESVGETESSKSPASDIAKKNGHEDDHDAGHEDALREKPNQTIEPIVSTTIVTDALGAEVIFETVPVRIATISPTATELLYAAGGSSILRDRASNYPEAVQSLPNVGSAYNPSIESILAAQPDLIVVEALTQGRLVPPLSKAGLRVMAIKVETVADLKKHIEDLGQILGNEDIASKKISEIEDRLNNAKSDDGRSVLILISDQERNLYAATSKSYTGLIATTAGMVNSASELSDSGPYPGFAMMSPESILEANPEVIITISPAPAPAPRLSETIRLIPPFAALKAMQTGSIIEGDVALFLQAPGPRIVEAVEFLNQSLD